MVPFQIWYPFQGRLRVKSQNRCAKHDLRYRSKCSHYVCPWFEGCSKLNCKRKASWWNFQLRLGTFSSWACRTGFWNNQQLSHFLRLSFLWLNWLTRHLRQLQLGRSEVHMRWSHKVWATKVAWLFWKSSHTMKLVAWRRLLDVDRRLSWQWLARDPKFSDPNMACSI